MVVGYSGGAEEEGELYTETYLHRRAQLYLPRERDTGWGKALSFRDPSPIFLNFFFWREEGFFEQTTKIYNKADSKSLDGKAARLFDGLRQLLMHLLIGRVRGQVQPVKACVRLW